MKRIDEAIVSFGRFRPLKWLLTIFLPLIFGMLLLAVPVISEAALVCADCHTAPHGSNCGTCSVNCHTDKPANIKHRTGPGTPLANFSTDQGKTAACVTCHIGPGTNMVHPFRINVDPNVSLVGYADLNDSCGQCHGSGTDPNAPARPVTAFWIPKNILAAFAKGMHSPVINDLPALPPGAGVGQCGPDAFVTPTQGNTTTSFTVSDSSTFLGGLTGKVYIDWGDGSPMEKIAAGANSGPHAYANPGTYRIRKTTQDDQFGFNCWKEAQVTVSNMAPGGYGSIDITANACAGGALGNVNVYLTSGNLQFHGYTNSTGMLTLPLVSNTMPVGTYALNVLGPAGKICHPTSACDSVLSATVNVPGTLIVYCQ